MSLATTSRPSTKTPSLHASEPAPSDPWLSVVAHNVKGLHFGVVQIVVHDSKVVQIERTERTRFDVPQTLPGR